MTAAPVDPFVLQRETDDLQVLARFTITGEPASKARARFSGATKRHYTPANTRAAEERVAWCFRQAVRGHTPSSDESFGVSAAFFCGSGQRRDVDNMVKLILDGLNGIAWVDDSQVTEVSGKLQRYAPEARTEVLVYRTVTPAPPSKACEQCGKLFPVFPSQKDRRFCDRACGYAWRSDQSKRTCEHCGKAFQARRRLADGTGRYCTRACAYAAKSVTRDCTQCGTAFVIARSLAPNVIPMCSQECRVTYWRVHRAKAAKGVCLDCGGSTSKKSYERCQACAIVHQQNGAPA